MNWEYLGPMNPPVPHVRPDTWPGPLSEPNHLRFVHQRVAPNSIVLPPVCGIRHINPPGSTATNSISSLGLNHRRLPQFYTIFLDLSPRSPRCFRDASGRVTRWAIRRSIHIKKG